MNAIAELEFELAYYDVKDQHVSNYSWKTFFKWKIEVKFAKRKEIIYIRGIYFCCSYFFSFNAVDFGDK